MVEGTPCRFSPHLEIGRAIPATSILSERVFSSAGNVVDKKRVRLKPENVDPRVCLRGNKDFVDWEK